MEAAIKEVPCRLSVILAREAPIGVIFRRGPSKWVKIIKWNTDTDEFEVGQWFHGRIYEDRSDLSPNGSKLLYMAAKYTNRDKSTGEVWTAVSKVPYLTALALFSHKDSGTWQGGGLFLSHDEIWIDAQPAPGTDTFFAHPNHRVESLKVTAYPADRTAFQRKRNGWRNHEKLHPTKNLGLRIKRGTFILQDKTKILEILLQGAVWADWDKSGRLVYAKEGKLFSGEINVTSEIVSQEIANFNSQNPEPKETPDWAKVW